MANVAPSTTVTYTGAELTSYLLNGGTPQTIDSDGVSTAGKKTAQLVAGTDFSKPYTAATATASDSSSESQTQASSTLAGAAAAASSTATAAAAVSDASSGSSSGSSVKLNTAAIVGIVVGTVALLAVIALILFLLARHKRAKDRQRLRNSNSPTEEKFPDSAPPSPKGSTNGGGAAAVGAAAATKSSADPFHDDKADKQAALKRNISNPRRQQSDVTASFDFGGLVPTKNNYGKDGKPIIAPASWDERDVGRPFSMTRAASPSSTVGVVGDETPIDFVSKQKYHSPSKQNSTSPNKQSENGGTAIMSVKRKAAPQDRQLPIMRPASKTMSPFDNSLSNGPASGVAPAAVGVRSNSNNSIASTASSMTVRKARPTPIQIPPLNNSESRDSIIFDKTISPPATMPPTIPTPPLPSMEFRKEWERLKRESSTSVDSTDTTILDEVDAPDVPVETTTTTTMTTMTKTVTKTPLGSRQSLTNMPLPERNGSTGKTIPPTLIIASPPKASAGDILKKEKTSLRVPSVISTTSFSSDSSISSSTAPPANASTNKRTPSMVAATAKWAEKRKALNAQLASQHNAREARKDPLPNNAIEKVQEARKSGSGLQPSPALDENRDTPRKREVEGRKNVIGESTESVGSPTLSVFKCYDPERESTFVPGEAMNMIRVMQQEDKENMPVPPN